MSDYTKKLKSDLLEQFRGRQKIEALLEVIGKQFNDIAKFYEQIRTETDVGNAVGKQLDGIGDIVILSRSDVLKYIPDTNRGETVDDETYRQYLIYKILKNTTDCTYQNIVKAFKMFWDKPLYYKEPQDEPATIVLDTGEMNGNVDTSPLFRTPSIKAAGVTLRIYARTSTDLDPATIHMISGIGYAITETTIPSI